LIFEAEFFERKVNVFVVNCVSGFPSRSSQKIFQISKFLKVPELVVANQSTTRPSIHADRKFFYVQYVVADQNLFISDPDPTRQVITDPDPTCQVITDPTFWVISVTDLISF